MGKYSNKGDFNSDTAIKAGKDTQFDSQKGKEIGKATQFGNGEKNPSYSPEHANLRRRITQWLGDNFDHFLEDVSTLDPKNRAELFLSLCKFALPTLKQVDLDVSVDDSTKLMSWTIVPASPNPKVIPVDHTPQLIKAATEEIIRQELEEDEDDDKNLDDEECK